MLLQHRPGRDQDAEGEAGQGQPARCRHTIVSGDALDPQADARAATRGGVEYRRFREDGRTVVTWERDGHTCVLSGKAVRPAELLTLADWRGKGAIPF